MRAVLLSLGVLAFAAPPAWAQVDPSVHDMIQSLKPGDTRGIHQAKPGTTANSPPEPQGGAAQPPPSLSLTVEFATDSTDLAPQARQTLDRLGRALTSQELAGYRFRIEGHTDTVGSPAYNQALSERRASAVQAYLEGNFGVAPTRLQAVGLGQEGLLVPTPPQTANAHNRRVKVVNLGS